MDHRPADDAELSASELRSVQLGVLVELDAWCRRHGARYYLAYGTLLGAVRHGGYIPWDDDVDVMMHRADYDRLLAAFADDAPAHLSLASAPARPEWPLPYAKLCDDRTVLREPLADPVDMGVNLDVFPIDAVPSGPAARRAQALLLRALRWAVELHYIDPRRGRAWHGPTALRLVRPFLRLLPVRVLVGLDTWVARHPPGPSDEVGVRVGSFDWSVPLECLEAPSELEFEGIRCWAPTDCDTVLAALYGDYLVLPPEDQQVSHHAFTATRRSHPPA